MFRRIGALKSVYVVSVRWVDSIGRGMICRSDWRVLQFWSLIFHDVLTVDWICKVMRWIRHQIRVQKRWLLSHVIRSSFFKLFFNKRRKNCIVMMGWHHSGIRLSWIYNWCSSRRHHGCFVYHRRLHTLMYWSSVVHSAVFVVHWSVHLSYWSLHVSRQHICIHINFHFQSWIQIWKIRVHCSDFFFGFFSW